MNTDFAAGPLPADAAVLPGHGIHVSFVTRTFPVSAVVPMGWCAAEPRRRAGAAAAEAGRSAGRRERGAARARGRRERGPARARAGASAGRRGAGAAGPPRGRRRAPAAEFDVDRNYRGQRRTRWPRSGEFDARADTNGGQVGGAGPARSSALGRPVGSDVRRAERRTRPQTRDEFDVVLDNRGQRRTRRPRCRGSPSHAPAMPRLAIPRGSPPARVTVRGARLRRSRRAPSRPRLSNSAPAVPAAPVELGAARRPPAPLRAPRSDRPAARAPA